MSAARVHCSRAWCPNLNQPHENDQGSSQSKKKKRAGPQETSISRKTAASRHTQTPTQREIPEKTKEAKARLTRESKPTSGAHQHQVQTPQSTNQGNWGRKRPLAETPRQAAKLGRILPNFRPEAPSGGIHAARRPAPPQPETPHRRHEGAFSSPFAPRINHGRFSPPRKY